MPASAIRNLFLKKTHIIKILNNAFIYTILLNLYIIINIYENFNLWLGFYRKKACQKFVKSKKKFNFFRERNFDLKDNFVKN